MRINILTIAVILGLSSCGGELTIDEKKAALEAKKTELAKLENEIRQMEAEILAVDSSYTTAKDERLIVVTKTIAPEKFEHFFEVNGTIEAEEIANVSTEMGGQIKKINVKEGDRVSAGQTLATLNSSVIQKSLEEIDNGIVLAQTVFDRQSRLWQQKIGSEIQFLEAKNNLEQLQKKRASVATQADLSTIRAPFAGVVDRIYQKEGELAAPGMPLLTVVNMNRMRVKADVSENYVQAVKQNSMVDIDFPSFGFAIKAPIRTVSSIINPANRAFQVEAFVNNSNGLLKPNGIATIRIKDFEADSALVVPAKCVSKDGKGDYVFTIQSVDGKEKATKTYVKIDRSSLGMTMVTEGLKPSDRVIVEGYNEVANGDEVKTESIGN
jgi:membrane fusion protein (multidrug efflux system)